LCIEVIVLALARQKKRTQIYRGLKDWNTHARLSFRRGFRGLIIWNGDDQWFELLLAECH
jgi:hypothetical protein